MFIDCLKTILENILHNQSWFYDFVLPLKLIISKNIKPTWII